LQSSTAVGNEELQNAKKKVKKVETKIQITKD